MSGICAIWQRQDPRGVAETAGAVCDGLALHSAERRSIVSHGAAAVGASARFANQQTYQDERFLVACAADIYNEPELRQLVDSSDKASDPSIAAMLARLYQRFGAGFLEKLRGAFSIVLW